MAPEFECKWQYTTSNNAVLREGMYDNLWFEFIYIGSLTTSS